MGYKVSGPQCSSSSGCAARSVDIEPSRDQSAERREDYEVPLSYTAGLRRGQKIGWRDWVNGLSDLRLPPFG